MKSFKYLFLALIISLFSVMSVNAYEIKKDGVNKVLEDYDFYVYEKDIRMGKETLTAGADSFKKVDNKYYYTGTAADLASKSFTIKFSNVVHGKDGKVYDLALTFSNINFLNFSNNQAIIGEWYPSSDTTNNANDHLYFLARDFLHEDSDSNFEQLSAHIDMTSKVLKHGTDTAVNGKLLLGFIDLDIYDKNKSYQTTSPEWYNNYQEGLIISSGLLSDIHLSTDSILKYANNNELFSSATDNESWKSGFTYLAQSSGSTVKWSGTSCGTQIFVDLLDKLSSYKVKATKEGEGTISPAGDSNGITTVLGSGHEKRTFTMTPAAGWRLGGLKINDSSIEASGLKSVNIPSNGKYIFYDIDSDKAIHAIFERIPQYTITTEVVNGTIDPSVTVNSGEDVTINFAPKTGYVFKSITFDDGSAYNTTAGTAPTSHTFTNVTANHHIKVEYAPFVAPENPVKNVNVSKATVGDEVVYTINQKVNTKGTDIWLRYTSFKITDVVPKGLEIISATLSGLPDHTVTYEPPKPSTGDENVHVGGVQPLPYYGRFVVSGNSVTFDATSDYLSAMPMEGETYTLTIRAKVLDEGAKLLENKAVSTINGVEYESNKTETAIYYKITTAVENGVIDDSREVVSGEDAVITYTANDGYELDKVTVDGKEVPLTGNEKSYTFTNVLANHDIKVVFKKINNPKTGYTSILTIVGIIPVGLCGYYLVKKKEVFKRV